MKFDPGGAELFHADIRTDGHTVMTKLIVAFPNFAKAPKKILSRDKIVCLARN
jgi:hypothetical protein